MAYYYCQKYFIASTSCLTADRNGWLTAGVNHQTPPFHPRAKRVEIVEEIDSWRHSSGVTGVTRGAFPTPRAGAQRWSLKM
jgi:hypothetical protein